jgi:8-oxo-dGTP pyrophosphatase MutT (NUDIX family)
MPKKPLKIVCCLIFDAQDRLLLLKRHPDDLGGGMWGLPGGKQDADEDPLTAAKRELKEETSLEVNSVSYLGLHEVRMPHGSVHMKSFHARVSGEEAILLNPDEHDSYRWQDISSLLVAERIMWGIPTALADFGLLGSLTADPTLADGSQAILLERAKLQGFNGLMPKL